MGRHSVVPDEKLPEIKVSYDAGQTIDGLARTLGCSFSVAYGALKRAGVRFRRGRSKRGANDNAEPRPKGKPRLRRFEVQEQVQDRVIHLSRTHASIRDNTSMFPGKVVAAIEPDRILKSGMHSKKIGARVIKGEWTGFPIYTITLEERATCPSTCHHFHTCFGNTMNWSERLKAGPDFERRLGDELWLMSRRHPEGFVIRAHVLGDFYSVAYVDLWRGWLEAFPMLRAFGYTAWAPETPIGGAVRKLALERWERFAIRLSVPGERDDPWPQAVAAWSVPKGDQYGSAIVCPAQTGKTDCCGSCGLCWGTRRHIAFVVH